MVIKHLLGFSQSALSRAFGTIKRTYRQQNGTTVILIALLAAVLFGFASLGVEVVLALQTQRQMQAAADTAVIAAAIAYAAADETWPQAGYAVVANAGFTSAHHDCNSADSDVVSIQSPPCHGTHAGDDQYVEALIRNPFALWLSRPLGYEGPFVLQGRAVATVLTARGCAAILDPTDVSALDIGGTASATFSNCTIIVNSTADPAAKVAGGGTLVCDHLFVRGRQTGVVPTDCKYTENAQPIADPYLNVEPSFVSSATTIKGLAVAGRSVTGSNENITPVDQVKNPNGLNPVLLSGGGIPESGNSGVHTWKFCPGIYVIDGGSDGGQFSLTTNGDQVQLLPNTDPSCVGDVGTGIAFVLTSSTTASKIPSVKVQSGIILGTATAPLKGIDTAQSTASGADANTRLPEDTLFWQNRNAPNKSPGSGFDGTTALSGILYFPQDMLTLAGNASASSPCFQLVAWDLKITGNPRFTIQGCSFATQLAIRATPLLVE